MEKTPEFGDTSFRRARREAAIILGAWAVCLLWTVGYSHFFGYDKTQLQLIWGMPSWVVVGVLLPWIAATIFSVWFSLRCIKDE